MEFEYPWEFAGRRSAVMAPNGMVATSHPLAARTGTRVLEEGGTAADAAVATAAVLNVVEPHMTGIGGDAFALTQFNGEYRALNASGRTPAEADLESYRERTDVEEDGEPVMPAEGGLPVTVPGALDGWVTLLDAHGTFDLADLLEPAIEYAEDGVPVSEYVARQWTTAQERIAGVEESARTFLPDDRAPEPGERFSNPAFAESLEWIARDGPEALYGGGLGERVVEVVQDHGGTLTLSDMEAHESTWEEPISTEYGGIEVLEHPPNGQGIVALEALNLAAELGIEGDPTDEQRLHRLIEATKLAFADGYAHVSDPEHVDVPTETMRSKDYARERVNEIGTGARTYDAKAGEHANTVYLSIVDPQGNAVSFINSIYMSFGSGLTAGGFALQNRGHSFSLDPDHPNRLVPGKRPFHTIIPAMLREDGEFRASWGVMGGSMQPQGHLQVAANMAAGLNPQAALDAPRFRWLDGTRVALETSRMPDEVVEGLRERGHEVVEEAAFFDEGGHWGGGQIVYRDDDGTLIGGSDPRKDGQAVGF
ncbi:gamma-glutamyltransferase [Halalkalicoccus jeotgali]|uniref:Gamma-glutamyltransferase n=1 Tax=Halalkalicoccus jeotgali (strain DSM 18796 / CECT 7217 / JCM 14584 / KCTC 4019 / B3) TaxID=795797 RepID=D8J5F7_HALJB|nr:gamma-glutamyltransferase [Halalkalicoccus jeotgali]ADJ15653.1 gamma-glutamyltransferase [Halalkalicoccus jeotgali B3]ELY36577.1 gamma-glutamyltransferase [Halalkalicoccus jeotgali B3]